ncbi:hypothetical protein HRbin24_00047 [bacterium HR24]|nr:hypothetical protein [Chloroflexota bacterium]GBD12047.1 hypothetical protein HRbin24_00047 [bacterium HR24]
MGLITLGGVQRGESMLRATTAARLLTVAVLLLALGSIGLGLPARAWADAPPPSAAQQDQGESGAEPPTGQETPQQRPPYYYAPGPVGEGGIVGFFTGIGSTISKVGECFGDLPKCFLDVFVGFIKLIFAPFVALVEFTFNDLLGNTGKEVTVHAPFVQDMMQVTRAIALGLLAVILMWGGVAIMTNRHIASPYHEVGELLPRATAAIALIAVFPWLATFLVDVNNVLVRAVIHPDELKNTGMELLNSLGVVPMIIFWIVMLVLGVFLAGQLFMRFVILDLLLVTGPIAFMLWILPQTRKWSSLWADLFPATVFQQALQVWTLVLGFRLVNIIWQESGGTLGLLYIPVQGAAGVSVPLVVTAVAAIAVMLAALKVPDLLSRAVGYWQPGWSPVISTVNLVRSFTRTNSGSS